MTEPPVAALTVKVYICSKFAVIVALAVKVTVVEALLVLAIVAPDPVVQLTNLYPLGAVAVMGVGAFAL